MAKVSEEIKNQIVTIIRKDLEDIASTDIIRSIKDYQALIEETTGVKLTPAGVGHFISTASYDMRDNDGNPIRLIRFTDNRKFYYKTIKVVYSHLEKRKSVACIVIDNTGELIEIHDYNKPYDEKHIDDIYRRYPENVCYVKYENQSIPFQMLLSRLFPADGVVPEWLFSYPELLSQALNIRIWWKDVAKTIDKGDINLTRTLTGYNENNTCIENFLYRIEDIQLTRKVTNSNDLKTLKENYNIVREFIQWDDRFKNFLPYVFHSFVTVGRKIAVNTARGFKNFNAGTLCDLFVKAYRFDALSILDENRDFEYNEKLLEDYTSAKKKEILAKKLTRLNFLHRRIIDGYEIIVPQSLEDLQKEGKAQNNCVGHYYNDSIIDGENLIYFIREKENPTKSFVTCRYNLNSKKTTEYRIKNNYWYDNKPLIDKIDALIRNNII